MISNESLPYFGKINSISKIIKVDNGKEKYYLIKRYDTDGNERDEEFFVPINLENTKGIMEDFCKDLKDYLAKNEKKYVELKKKKKLFDNELFLNKLGLFEKFSRAGICLGTLLVGLTISVISIPVFFLFGMCILVVSGVGVVVVRDVNKELDESKFVSSYDEYSRKLNDFRSCLESKFKNEVTKYNGLGKGKSMGNSLRMKKVKVLN